MMSHVKPIDPGATYNDAEAADLLRLTVKDLRRCVPYRGTTNRRFYIGAELTAWMISQMIKPKDQ